MPPISPLGPRFDVAALNGPNANGPAATTGFGNSPVWGDGFASSGAVAPNQWLAEVATAFSALLPMGLQQRQFPVLDNQFVLPRFGPNGANMAYPAPAVGQFAIVQDPLNGQYLLVERLRPDAVRLNLAPLTQAPPTPAPASATPGFVSTSAPDRKTGLPRSGILTPDSQGDMSIPGIGDCKLETYTDSKGRTRERVIGPDGKVLKDGIKPGHSFSLKIPGTNYKYKFSPQPDGTFKVQLKKPGFWSSLVSGLLKFLPIISTILSFLPPPFCIIGMALRLATAALNLEEGIRKGNWKQAVLGGASAFAGAAGAFDPGSELANVANTVNSGARLAVAVDNIPSQGIGGVLGAANAGMSFGGSLSVTSGNDALAADFARAQAELRGPVPSPLPAYLLNGNIKG